MGHGLSLEQSKQIVDAVCASRQDYERFVAEPAAFIDSLGIDSIAALGVCSSFNGAAPSFETMLAQRDALAGRLLIAHLAFTIHNVLAPNESHQQHASRSTGEAFTQSRHH